MVLRLPAGNLRNNFYKVQKTKFQVIPGIQMTIQDMKQSLKSFLINHHLSRLAKPFAPFLGHILVFHRVVTPDGNLRLPENQEYEITPDFLHKIISFYRQRNYDFISLDEMLERMNKKGAANRFVAFTFDDGYTDTLTTAFPILKEENIPLCIYITTDFPDRKAAQWWNMLEESLLTQNQLNFTLEDKPYQIICSSFGEKRDAFKMICRLVLKSNGGITSAWKAIFEQLGVDQAATTEKLALSWDQINDLGREPLVTIGAHTCTHPPLAALTEEEALAEIQNSREIIQKKTGLTVDHFAYPYGSHLEVTDREAKLAASVGFKSAVTTETGNIYTYHRKKTMLLPRINVNEADDLKTLTLAADGCIPQTLSRV